jgi:hypothetical protein
MMTTQLASNYRAIEKRQKRPLNCPISPMTVNNDEQDDLCYSDYWRNIIMTNRTPLEAAEAQARRARNHYEALAGADGAPKTVYEDAEEEAFRLRIFAAESARIHAINHKLDALSMKYFNEPIEADFRVRNIPNNDGDPEAAADINIDRAKDNCRAMITALDAMKRPSADHRQLVDFVTASFGIISEISLPVNSQSRLLLIMKLAGVSF